MDASLKTILQEILDSVNISCFENDFATVSYPAIKKLRRHIQEDNDNIAKAQKIIDLSSDRKKVAEKTWLEADEELTEGVYIIDSDSWAFDGDRMMMVFYYENDVAGDPSEAATFVVVFKKDSDKVQECYINW